MKVEKGPLKCRVANWLFNRLHRWGPWVEFPIGHDEGGGLMKQIGQFAETKCQNCGQVVPTSPTMYDALKEDKS